ncbi:hypothetical protein HZ326_21248 [Fusarium oxysporum f. sp. albedinis]|nr:hypothetical protein HZ326_21248 [Fusarium oxysporum f. sp. albedinis]
MGKFTVNKRFSGCNLNETLEPDFILYCWDLIRQIHLEKAQLSRIGPDNTNDQTILHTWGLYIMTSDAKICTLSFRGA